MCVYIVMCMCVGVCTVVVEKRNGPLEVQRDLNNDVIDDE